ncbi:ParA family protein [Pontixanthobacter aestiaquae]|uniref:AAA family ATPase n=1 Tax=Pontixanthobacter aestiaquae TaxID=1509367 RepID=A0A844Z140_9SPHN|nr:ParA family protein [Pontixanthobacter aestiaquae]MDN3646574.1 ParA family protein [Pontixanthobacter aestiaquae]MXO82441.1 AAA family ATPase [Pontixanthobacter aestiaquae]
MAVIAIYSVKGGVGKTTLSANLAWYASSTYKHRTLVWDLDAAGGAGFLLGVDPDPVLPAETLFSRQKSPHDFIQQTGHERLSVLPADESLRSIDSYFSRVVRRDSLARTAARFKSGYERIFIDCPPVLNSLSRQIMRAADVVIVPLPPSPLSTRAFQLVADEVKATGAKHAPMLPVLSMLDMRRTLHRKAREDAPDWPTIPFASAAEQCAVRRQPVGTFAPRSPAAQSFAGLSAAIERKLSSRGE